MHITLRTNEKIYVNGAVLRADRKVSLELMNDAVFLLENHIMQEEDATTPMRQWYFVVQLMLMEGTERTENRSLFEKHGTAMASIYGDRKILEAMAKVASSVERRRYFEALKTIRSILPLEDAILNPAPALAEAS